MKVHGDSRRVYLLLSLLFLSTLPLAPSQAREICVQFTRGVDFNWQAQALLALQEVRRGPGASWVRGENGRRMRLNITSLKRATGNTPSLEAGFWSGSSGIPWQSSVLCWEQPFL